MKFTTKLPDKVGFYWYCNFGESTPTILEVTKDYSSGKLYASNEEFTVSIEKGKSRKQLISEWKKHFEEEPELTDGFMYGEEVWCYIPCPTLPNGKKITPSCY